MNQMYCPNCGWRNLDEFRYGGEQHSRPAPASVDPSHWTDYLYLRDNPAGFLHECWYHRLGCGQWFVAERDTRRNVLRGAGSVESSE